MGIRIRSIGVVSYKLPDLQLESKTFGHITSTPKPGLAISNIKVNPENGLGDIAVLETNVNAAAKGEFSCISNLNVNNLEYDY